MADVEDRVEPGRKTLPPGGGVSACSSGGRRCSSSCCSPRSPTARASHPTSWTRPLLHRPERGRDRDHRAPDPDHHHGEIDLSVASMLGLTGLFMAELFKHGWPIWPAMIAAVLLGGARRVQRLPDHAHRPAIARRHDRDADALPRHRAGILPSDTISGFPQGLANIGVVPIRTRTSRIRSSSSWRSRSSSESSSTRRRWGARSSPSARTRRRPSTPVSASSGSSSGSSSSR